MLSDYKNILSVVNFKEGKTKIFLKTSGYEKLEKLKKDIIIKKVIIIQKNSRMFLERQNFNKLKHDIISLQTFCRIVIAKKTLLNLMKLRSSIIIQKEIRCYICKKNYKQCLKRIKSIQLFYRNYKNRVINGASIKIQSKYRSVYYI